MKDKLQRDQKMSKTPLPPGEKVGKELKAYVVKDRGGAVWTETLNVDADSAWRTALDLSKVVDESDIVESFHLAVEQMRHAGFALVELDLLYRVVKTLMPSLTREHPEPRSGEGKS
jgi:hypothetical protein